MIKRILICDDEPHVLEGLRYLLRSATRQIVTARNGREALERLQAEQFDLLLTDVMMPEMNGLELVAELRARNATRDLPIIIVTARGQANDAEVAQETWRAHLLAKPFDPRAIRELVGRILGDTPCPAAR